MTNYLSFDCNKFLYLRLFKNNTFTSTFFSISLFVHFVLKSWDLTVSRLLLHISVHYL